MKRTALAFLIATFILSSFSHEKKDTSGYAIAKQMFEKASTINSLIYTLTKEERFEGKMVRQVSLTKMEKEPFKVYIRQSYPKDGMEVLYVKNENNDKAIVNPNGFPWINLKLRPLEGIMRHEQHHTIFQSGYDHVISILEFLCNKYQDDIDSIVTYNGLLEYKNRQCHSISFNNPNFKYINYTIRENETLGDIASRLMLSEHMILEKNADVKGYDDVEEGQVIKIPNDYSPKMLLYIDVKELIPVRMDVYDDQGLYEKYEYSGVSINPNLEQNEFSKDHPNYGF